MGVANKEGVAGSEGIQEKALEMLISKLESAKTRFFREHVREGILGGGGEISKSNVFNSLVSGLVHAECDGCLGGCGS